MNVLRNRRGNAMPFAIAITLSLLILMCGASEYIRLLIISYGVRDAMQSAVNASVVANYDDAYSTLREGYSGGYALSDGRWREQLDNGDIYGRLTKTLGLKNEGSQYIKYLEDRSVEYTLSGLNAEIINPPLAQGSTAQNLTVKANIQAEIPVSFLNKPLPPVKINIKITAAYTPKF
jgi:hypothetical protein